MELIEVDYTGKNFILNDVIDVEKETLKKIVLLTDKGQRVGDFLLVDKKGDGESNGYYREIVIFEYKGHLYQVMAISYGESELTVTKPFRVFKKERTYTKTSYSTHLTEESDKETIDKIRKEIKK